MIVMLLKIGVPRGETTWNLKSLKALKSLNTLRHPDGNINENAMKYDTGGFQGGGATWGLKSLKSPKSLKSLNTLRHPRWKMKHPSHTFGRFGQNLCVFIHFDPRHTKWSTPLTRLAVLVKKV